MATSNFPSLVYRIPPCPPPINVSPLAMLQLLLAMIIEATKQVDSEYEGTVESLLTSGCCNCETPAYLDITESGLWFLLYNALTPGGAEPNDIICCNCPQTDYAAMVTMLEDFCLGLQDLNPEFGCGDWYGPEIACCSCYTLIQWRSAILRGLQDWIEVLTLTEPTLEEAYIVGRGFNPLGSYPIEKIRRAVIAPVPTPT